MVSACNGSKKFLIGVNRRIRGETLDLIEVSLDTPLTQNAVRLHFGNNIIPSFGIIERPQGINFFLNYFSSTGTEPCVVIAVVTVNKELHRIVFPHPVALQRWVSL